jgi:beta-mannosidase
VHVINEAPRVLKARLSLQCLRAGEVAVIEGSRELVLGARGSVELPAAALFDSFFDTTYAHRLGPPAHDVSVAAIFDSGTGDRLAEAFHFPLGRGSARSDLGLTAHAEVRDGGWVLKLHTERLAQSVHVEDAHYRAHDEWFHLPPWTERVLKLLPRGTSGAAPSGAVHALNALVPVTFQG